MQLVCPSCAAYNAVPDERLLDEPMCGKCGKSLTPREPIALDDASFDRYVQGTEIPVLVDYGADWCGPCRMMAPHFAAAAARVPEVRFAKVDTELGGVRIPAGSALNVRYAAANRDEKVFANPQRADLDRKGLRNHMAFGAGIHYCAGANLARLEMRLSIEGLLMRLRDIRLARPSEPIHYVEKLAVRGFLNLPITFASS